MVDNQIRDFQRQSSLKHQWRKEPSCCICHTPFGVIGVVYIKRYYCKHCFRAICSNCSSEEVDIQDVRKTELSCKECAPSQTPASFSHEFKDKTIKIYEEIANLHRKINACNASIAKQQEKRECWTNKLEIEENSFVSMETEELITKLRLEKHAFLEKIAQMRKEIDDICQEIEEQETIYFESETYLVEEKHQMDINKKRSEELHKTLSNTLDRNIKLNEAIESLDIPKSIKKKELRENYERLTKEEKIYKEKQGKLKEELENAEGEIEVRNRELEKIDEGVEVVGNEDEEEIIIKELNCRLEEQKKLIQNLKDEIKQSEMKNDPITKENCKCEVF
jgi:chromosome segregation ATPase